MEDEIDEDVGKDELADLKGSIEKKEKKKK